MTRRTYLETQRFKQAVRRAEWRRRMLWARKDWRMQMDFPRVVAVPMASRVMTATGQFLGWERRP